MNLVIQFKGGVLDGYDHDVTKYAPRNKDNWRSVDFVYFVNAAGKIVERYRAGWTSNNLLGGSSNAETKTFELTDDLVAKPGEKALRFVI